MDFSVSQKHFPSPLPHARAKELLEEAGIYFDDLQNLTALEPDVSQKTSELSEGSKDFVDKIDQLQKRVANTIHLLDELANETEKQKRKAIAARNVWRLMARQREAERQQLQALIAEKRSQFERDRIQYEALLKMESAQNLLINQFI